jgi:hypothetical protein
MLATLFIAKKESVSVSHGLPDRHSSTVYFLSSKKIPEKTTRDPIVSSCLVLASSLQTLQRFIDKEPFSKI